MPPPPTPGDWSTRGLLNGASIQPPRPHLLSSPLPSSLPCSRPPLTVPILTVADAVESRPSQRRSRGAFGATTSRLRLGSPTLRAAHAGVRLLGSALRCGRSFRFGDASTLWCGPCGACSRYGSVGIHVAMLAGCIEVKVFLDNNTMENDGSVLDLHSRRRERGRFASATRERVHRERHTRDSNFASYTCCRLLSVKLSR